MSALRPYNEDHELDNNESNNIHFAQILQKRITRREFIAKAASGVAALTLTSSLTGCDDDDHSSESTTPDPEQIQQLSFQPVSKNLDDWVTVPEGYEVDVIYATGDPINTSQAEWDENNIPSGPSYQLRSGDCHDGMSFFGLNSNTGKFDPNASDEGLLVMNHEYITPAFLHPNGPTSVDGHRNENEVIREVNSHGVSIIHVVKDPTTNQVTINKDSAYNRRITASTLMDFSGPIKSSDLVKTAYSKNGTQTRGTHNNCGNGETPWGTYLTAEENFIGYFSRIANDDLKRSAAEITGLNRYGLSQNSGSRYGWESAVANIESQDMYDRWNCSVIGQTATDDYRNGANTFGWIVEIDPFDPTNNPVKRSALGRFAHEDCTKSRAIEGQALAFYMGDDSRGEYIYKFVSDALWDEKDVNGGLAAGDKYMNKGRLYVAKFNDDASGEWIELSYGKNGLDQNNSVYPFKDQADIVTFARLAADAVGATKMDRPEWCSVNPKNGEVYVTLTNNSNRGQSYPTDAANPRNYSNAQDSTGNVNGHIIRLREADDKTTATAFTWDIFLFGSESGMAANVNLSDLNDNNDLSSPDGMWFDPRGVLWIQTDDSSYTYKTNCMMLAALPGQVGDGETVQALSGENSQITHVGAKLDDTQLRRFLVGPKDSEITGVTMTPDLKSIFINVQHPGEKSSVIYGNPATYNSHWPSNQQNHQNMTSRPRSATVVIRRTDGQAIAAVTE